MLVALLAQVEIPTTEPLQIETPDELSTWLVAAVVLTVGLVAARLILRLIRRVLMRTGADESLSLLFSRAAGWAVVTLTLFYALSLLGVQIGPLIGALGITGLVVALALQGILENVFAGLLIQARRPFVIGDEIQTGECRGRVTDITSRVVRIRSFTGEDLYVPNREVLNNTITNQSGPGRRRLDLVVGVAYGTDLDRARALAEASVRDLDEVLDSPPVTSHAHLFGESSIDLTVMVWHRPQEAVRWRVRSAAITAIDRAFNEADIVIPFPQRTVWLPPPDGEG